MSFDDDDLEDIFKQRRSHFTMNPTSIAFVALAFVAAAFVLCWCCRRRRQRGLVLQPPVTTVVVPASAGPAPYPQQLYQSPAPHQYPAATPYPTNATTYPNAGAPYPTGGAPYPTGGAPYPTGGAPYPTGGAPYPTGGAPYPTGAAPCPESALSGFTVPVPPPSYNEAVAHEAYSKQSPYNPSYPHA